MRFLLDTSIVSAPVAKRPNSRVVGRIQRNAEQSAIAAPVWHELNYGVGRLPTSKRRTALTEYLRDVVEASFPILAYDDKAAAWHARERVRLETLGKPAPYVDGQIAAIAVTNGLILVTGNPKCFGSFRGLEVQDWAKARR